MPRLCRGQHLHPIQPNSSPHVSECASSRPIYSTVNRTTSAVSRPNQTWLELAWKTGNVSRIVMKADRAIKVVVATCMTNAEGEDVGDSKSKYRLRFHLRDTASVSASGQTLSRRLTAYESSDEYWLQYLCAVRRIEGAQADQAGPGALRRHRQNPKRLGTAWLPW